MLEEVQLKQDLLMQTTSTTHISNQDRSSYCPEKAELVKAKPLDVQIVCNSYNVDAIPEDQTDEWERVLDVHKIVQHSRYSPGTEEDIGRHKKVPSMVMTSASIM